jgi:SAM-dependent methyltransferase
MSFKDAKSRWNERYSKADGFLFGESPNVWLSGQTQWLDQCAAQAKAHGRQPQALAIADGEGRNGVWLAQRGWRVDSFDCSQVAVQRARQFAQQRQVAIDANVASLEDFTWPLERYDAIAAVYFQFAEPALRDASLQRMVQALRPGGIIVIEGYGPRQMMHRTGGPGVLENLYTTALLTQAFDGLQILASRDVEIELAEGSAHVGRSHVISMVAARH